MLKSSINPFSEITGKESNVQFQKHNISVAALPASSMENKFVSGKGAKIDQESSGLNAAVSKKDHCSKQSWYETADGFGKLAQPQNRAVAPKNENEKENPGSTAQMSSRVVTNSIIDKIEEDKEWVKIGDKDLDTKAASKVSLDANQGRSNANKDPMGPFDTKTQSQIMPKTQNDEAITEMNETEPTQDENSKIVGESSDEEEEPIKEGDHGAKISKVFRDRMRQYRRESKKLMPISDQVEFNNPANISEFQQGCYDNMRAQEESTMFDCEYIQKVQTELRDTSRAFLLEWIIDVHRKFRLTPECLYVTQFVLDQYLSRQKIQKSELHLLGVSVLLISTKYEEIYPPELRDLLAVSENKFTRDQVLKQEKLILNKLEFKISAPSAYRFLESYKRIAPIFEDKEVFFFAQYILEVSLLDITLMRFKPSELAAASLILSCKQLKKIDCWTKDLEKFTKYKKHDLATAISEVRQFLVEINPKFISTLKYKFSKPDYCKVANYEFKF